MGDPRATEITIHADATRLREEMEATRALLRPPEELAWIDHIRERSYVRHVLAHHIEANDHRIPELRRKHSM